VMTNMIDCDSDSGYDNGNGISTIMEVGGEFDKRS
jgi:hypothetical protein